MRNLFTLLIAIAIFSGCNNKHSLVVTNKDLIRVTVPNTEKVLWDSTVTKTGRTYSFRAPEFEIDGKLCSCQLSLAKLTGTLEKLKNGVTEYNVEGNLSEI